MRCCTDIIRGSVAMCVFMGRSTRRMALFSAALWTVRRPIAGWKFRPGCSTGLHVLMNCADDRSPLSALDSLAALSALLDLALKDSSSIIECPAFGRMPILSRPESGRGPCAG